MSLRIKDIREYKGFSQYEMAEKMNISQSAYARFELSKTKIDLKRLGDFAKELNMSVIDVIAFPEIFINIKDIGKHLNLYEPEVIVQVKMKEEKSKEILKILLGEKGLEILNEKE